MDTPAAKSPGRRCVLDEAKKRQIVAMVTLGYSLRAAARIVGCDPASLRRARIRDPEFARELAAAFGVTEAIALQTVHDAAQQPRYWRAAVWLLERASPEQFARRPGTYTAEDVVQIYLGLMQALEPAVPLEEAQRGLRRLGVLLAEKENARTGRRRPRSAPVIPDIPTPPSTPNIPVQQAARIGPEEAFNTYQQWVIR